MSSLSEAEIRGDWNNVRGTEYHFVYALWLLICGGAASAAFYRGNDLLATPSAPPVMRGEDDVLPAVPLKTGHGDEDIWIQLKATGAEWTRSDILAGNLLLNFINNAFQSQREGRRWSVKLITQGLVQRAKLEEFIAAPETYRDLNIELGRILSAAQAQLRAAGFSEADTADDKVRSTALSVLLQLAQTQPVRLETLKAEIEAELAYAYPDRRLVKHVANTLMGALLNDAAAGPSAARVYDAEWLNEAAGMPVVARGQLDADPVAACSDSVRRSLPRDWDASLRCTRPRLEHALRQFDSARQTLFVLLGANGTGKTWAAADWAENGLSGRVRLFMPGSDLDRYTSLQELVAHRLESQTTAFWTPEQFLERLHTAAVVEGYPPIFIIDDLRVPSFGADVFRRDLGRLVEQCRAVGAKLVLTCQTQLWELHRLGAGISPGEIFSPGGAPPTGTASLDSGGERADSYSLILGNFTRDEQEEALRRRFGSENGSRIASRLRDPAFTLLSNPYLLARFIEQHGPQLVRDGGSLPLVTIDGLLDARVQGALEGAATAAEISVDDLRPAFDALAENLWEARPRSLSRAQAVESITPHLHGRSDAALNALHHQGLLTSEGGWHFTDQILGDRLFARLVGARRASADDVLNDLRPQEDAGTVGALLRGVINDPVALAERLLRRDDAWGSAVISGLAQCDPDDYRVLALLLTLSRTGKFPDADPFAALGQLAARGERAWKWAAELYLAEDALSQRRGARLLAPAMEFVPHKVEAAIRRRLSRIVTIHEMFFSDREKKREKIMDGALDPLRLINHRAAADAGRRIIGRYSHLIGEDDEDTDEQRNYLFEEDLDYARGRVALYGAASDLENILHDLRAGDDLTRYRASWAVLAVAKDRPELVRTALCEAITRETHTAVIGRLLIAAYYLVSPAPDDLLDALEGSRLLRWDEVSANNSGQVLMLLGNLAGERPRRVFGLLPTEPLQVYEPWIRAFLSEMLSYAWWRCAEHVDEVRPHFVRLTEPELDGLEEKFHPLALRGAAIAQLALLSLDRLPASELTGRQVFYPLWYRMFLFLEASKFSERHAREIIEFEGYGRLQELLLRCLHSEESMTLHPQENPLVQARYICASKCLEMLIAFATVMPEPRPLLDALPPDWQAARAAWQMLEAGRTEPSVVEFARRAAEEPTGTTSMQASHERDICRAQLARLEAEPRAALAGRRAQIGHPFLPNSGQAHALAELGGAHLDQFLALIADSVRGPDDLSTLFTFERQTSSWQGLLLARVFARMFYPRVISRKEARELCEEVLSTVRDLPPSVERSDYEAIYEAIALLLENRPFTIPALSAPESPLRQSHDLAVSLLEATQANSADPVLPTRLTGALNDRRGWMDTNSYELKDGVFSSGTGLYMIYFFPAVRLALIAVGSLVNQADPAARLMVERTEVHKASKNHWHEIHEPAGWRRGDLESALAWLDQQMLRTPNDERLPFWRGGILLQLRRLNEAEEALHRCLRLPSCDRLTRAVALYNLACVHALAGRNEECRNVLLESHRLNPIDREHTATDPDLESVRGEPWFVALINPEEEQGGAT
jgi:tetratricopeptide (TPR) repeat protein